jgi:hypothetical protein
VSETPTTASRIVRQASKFARQLISKAVQDAVWSPSPSFLNSFPPLQFTQRIGDKVATQGLLRPCVAACSEYAFWPRTTNDSCYFLRHHHTVCWPSTANCWSLRFHHAPFFSAAVWLAITAAHTSAGAVASAWISSGAATSIYINSGAATSIYINSRAATSAYINSGAATSAYINSRAAISTYINSRAATSASTGAELRAADRR